MQPSFRPSPPARAWLALLGSLLLALVLLIDSPAWAAPVLRPLNQTVPRPTPTSPNGDVATATPRPDDPGDDPGDEPGGEATPTEEEGDGLQLFPGQPGDGATGEGLHALVTVDQLNVREGPGTSFALIGSFIAGDRLTVVSRSEDGAWWYICCLPNNIPGWVSSQLVEPEFDRSQAATLIPVFGSEPAATPTPAGTPQPPARPDQSASQPLIMGFELDPPFVWQGITATLTISVTNPNAVDVHNVELSDELPAPLHLLDVSADADGEVEQFTTTSGATLIVARWATIPAETGVTATLVLSIDPALDNGAVIDNLVAVRGRNAPYAAAAITIGMPPILPPTFQ
jgi:uncharacterized repeat protein (TIGR01451 family)